MYKKKEQKSTTSSKTSSRQFNDNGEFSLDLKDKNTRRKVMSRINRFKDFAVVA